MVMLDNPPSHKVGGIRERMKAIGARLLCLPAYSPDFNPIEVIFAKLEAILCDKAAREVTDLWHITTSAFERSSKAECRNYLAAAGYDAYDSTYQMLL